jgi:hypothetical protein
MFERKHGEAGKGRDRPADAGICHMEGSKKPNIRTLASGCGRLRSMNTLSAGTSVIVFGAGALFLATASEAQMPLAPVKSEIAFTQVAQGCGPGRWRGPGGVCRGSGNRRCKPGYDWDATGRPCPG